ncbi:MAG: S8 family serine peptidase, partial [Candidatus Aminicenantes bacterium]|nr:S8 family serine peptidase [Candidatus Aminicenantes bacterium]
MIKSKKIFLILAIFFFVGALIFAGGPKRKALLDKSNAPKPYADSEVLVKFKQGIDLAAVNKFAAAHSLKLKKHFKFLSTSNGQEIVLLKSTKKIDAEVLAKTLRGDPKVEYATPNYRRELALTPNDTDFVNGKLWGMHNTGQTGGTADADIDAPEAWDISTGSSSVIVAVVDTGLDYTHPDLAANCWKNPGEIAGNGVDDDGNGYIDDVYGIDPAGTNGTVGDTDPMDGYGHGTHCAGSIGARGNNSRGVVGVNWNVKIMGLKFFDDAGEGGYDADSIECIQYAVYQKIHGQNVVAINASWGSVPGSTQDSGPLRDAIEFATNAGIVFCAAAGNGGSDGVGDNNDRTGGRNHHYPSDYTLPGIIAVAATDHNDALGSFSNYGATSIDLGAPGVAILSTIPPIYIPGSNDIFFDNMNGGVGNWTHGAISGTDYWQITTDQEGFANASFPVPSPPNFWSDRPASNYADNSNTWLAYNANIDLSGYVGQKIYFSIGSALAFEVSDHGYVEFSNNGGSTWTTIHDFTDEGWYWSNWSWLIPDSYKTSQFRMRFRLQSNNDGTTWIGWLIDNVGIGLANTYYDSWNGTSMATPHVTGAVAYLASIFSNETVAQRKSRILNGGDSKTSLAGKTVTGKRLNLYGAYSYTPPSQPAITVTSPNGGEVWTRGTAHTLIWTWSGTVGNVQIHYSLNSGVSWTQIVASTANSGSYSWNIGGTITLSANCLVRIREASDGDPSDTSNAVFAIVASTTETVSTPNMPSGPDTGMVGGSYAYSTGGSITSPPGHSVQYRFDWGDGTYTSWLPVGTTTASHSWSAAGTFNVRAMARCSIDFIQSAWSTSLPVTLDDTPTWAAVSRFAACASESQPTVEWHTASELGTVGFNLWRQDGKTGQYELVNSGLLPALPGSPQGGVYRFADPGAFPGEPMTYRLEEFDALGRTRSYGPFTVTFGGAAQQEPYDPGARMGREEPTDIYGFQRFERPRTTYELERLSARHQEQQRSAMLAAQGKDRARVTVKGRGLFYVTAAQVASSLGKSQAAAASFIAGYDLRLTGLGKEIAWLADANGAGIFFYNEGQETVYCDRNVYFLEKGRGRAMDTLSGGSAGLADSGQTFRETLHFESNQYALLGSYMNPLEDIWFWDYIEAGGGAKPFLIEVPGLASGKATLKASLQGATDTAAENDHHAIISLNGKQIGETVW